MPASWIVEAIDVFKDCHLSFPSCFPRMPPDQFCFDGFEERLDHCPAGDLQSKSAERGRVVIAITLAAHRYLEAVLA